MAELMKRWKYLQISRRGIAMDPSTGESFRLNETAGFILTSLQRDETPQQIAEELCKEFDGTYDSALSDVYEFVANLNIQGVGE